MAVLINVPLGIVAFVLAMRFLPPNSVRSKIIRFDLPSAIMNALTFGLLITALSGFARGQSTQLVLAEVAAMLVVGFFFVRRQLTMPVPCCRSTCCVSHSSLSLSALPSAPSARRCWRWSPCPFSAVDDGAQRSGDRSAANAVAVSDHGDAPLAGYLIEKCHAGLLGLSAC